MPFLMPLLLCLGSFVIYSFALVIYRLTIHPLRRFPGPKIAAATKWYESYFDVMKKPGGLYMHEVDRLHEIYGPIVRISPDELHVKDTEWFDVLYTNSGVRDKYPPAAHMLGVPQGTFGTVAHDAHRKRRAAVSPFFSKASVTNLEPTIHDKIEVLCENLRTQLSAGGVAEMRLNYLAMGTDTVYTHALGGDIGMLKNEQQAKDWHRTITKVAALSPMGKQFTWVIPIAKNIPMCILQTLFPDLARYESMRRSMSQQAADAIQRYEIASQDEALKKDSKKLASQNVFFSILSSGLPAQEKLRDRIAQEGFIVLAAGGETTSRVLGNATYHLLANKHTLLARLKEELATVMTDPNMRVDLRTLEQLPYLTAIVKESLRISTTVTSRLPVMAPKEALQYKEWKIPANTAVSMSTRDALMDPKFFPEPHVFRPERWLPNNPDLERISRAYLPFSRGSRMCQGINLALAELYMVLACVFRRFDLELYETVRERDVDVVSDFFLGDASPETRGIRVKACN